MFRAAGGESPRYFFDLQDGHRSEDPTGLECRDDEDAKAKAEVIAGQMAADAPLGSGNRYVAVLNESRVEIMIVRISDHPKV